MLSITSKTSKIALAAVVGLALAFALFAGVSVQKASAQSMSLTDLVNLFISLGIISPDKAAAAKAAVSSSATAASFSKDLTVGSSGADVTSLQNVLGVSPATGYFGSVTKAAVVKYQVAHGISGTGYVGPLTRAQLNAGGSVTTTTTTGGSTTVVNTGVEGTLTVDRGSVSDTTAYEGSMMAPVLSIKLQAKLSDIAVQRIKLDLGTNTSVYTKVFKTIYVVNDAGQVLAQADLNGNTVVKDGTDYYLTLGGLSYVVAKDSTKYLTIKADLYSSIKASTQSGCDGTGDTCSITLPADGVRGTDGAGIDQYGPTNSFSQSISVSTSLTDSATLALSTDSANYKTADVVATSGSNNDQYDKLPILAFDLRATKDDVKVTDLAVNIPSSTVNATATTAYLYDGSTLIATETIGSGSNASFSDSNQLFVVPKDTTKVYTVKVDIRNANNTATNVSATVGTISAQSVTSNNTVTASGSATGETMVVRKVGPVFTLVSKSISVSGTNNSGSTLSTSTITATFGVSVQALGGDVMFATQASSTGPMFGFRVYNSAGSEVAADANLASTTGFTVPSSGVVTANLASGSFTLQQNNSVTISPITVTIAGKTDNTGVPRSAIAVGIDQINWVASGNLQHSTFMSGKTDWRTNTQTP